MSTPSFLASVSRHPVVARRPRTLVLLITVLFCPSLSPAAPPELETAGNQIVIKATGEPVRLTGVNIPSLEWGTGEHLFESLSAAFNDWGINVVRLPVSGARWRAENPEGASYRATVISFIAQASSKRVYVILDLHEYGYATTDDAAFWDSAAGQFKNNPAVLFGLLNEPHGTTEAEWRDGKNGGPGIQGLLDTVRATGANNIVVAGGLDSAFKLRNILELGYALVDTPNGNGIVYDAHVYPWKGSAEHWVGPAFQNYPVLIGEIGHPDGTGFDGQSEFEDDASWVPKILDWVDTHNAHWTGWTFYPGADPAMLENYYTPTSYWGAPAKTRLLSYRNPDELRVIGGTVIGTTGTKDNPTSGMLTDYRHGAVAPFGDNLDNDTYYFDGPTPSGSWAGLDLHQAWRIRKIKYMPRHNGGDLMDGGVFQGANQPDFSDAVTLYTITQPPDDSRTLLQEIPFKNVYTGVYTPATITDTGAYRYVRYVGPTDSRSNVASILFYGKGLFGGTTVVNTIIDNTDSEHVTATGVWTASNTVSGYHGGNYLTTPSSPAGGKSVRFTPDLPLAGPYEVLMKWSAQSGRARDVPVDIITSDGTVQLAVDQRILGGQWNSLGVHSFDAGTAGGVLIGNAVTDTADAGAVIADAVRFVLTDGQPAPPPQVVLDSANTQYVTQIGAWQSSNSSTGYLGSGYLHDNNELKGTKSVAYAPDIPVSGLYHVFLNWTSMSNRSNQVIVEVHSTDGVTTRQVDQTIDGGIWNHIGAFNFTQGTAGRVVIRNDNPNGNQTNNGYVIADGVLFEMTSPAIILDNTASSGVTLTGSWTAGTTTNGYIGSNYLHDGDAAKGSKSVRFTPTVVTAGNYEIFARWTADGNRSDSVPIDIETPSGTATVVMDQRQNGGKWNSLGTYSLGAGTSNSVLVRTTGTTGYVIVDAVKLIKMP